MSNQRIIERGTAFLELLCAILAAGLWLFQENILAYIGIAVGPWPLLLLALLGLLRWLRTGRVFHGARFWPPLMLFMLAALVGLWTAYDLNLALHKFWLIIAALGLCWAMARQPDLTGIYLSLALWGLFGVILTSYFLMTHDWSAYPIKVPIITRFGRLLSQRLLTIPIDHSNPNFVGGMLATTLPCYVPLIVLSWRSKRLPIRRWLPPLWIAAGVITLLGVFLTVSRGAWMALGLTGLLWGIWRARELLQQRFHPPKRRYVIGAALVVGALLVLLAMSIAPSAALLNVATLQNRLTLWRSARQLIRDYFFTGIGLGMFEMHYAVYALLIHVGYVGYAHNLFLDLLIELGILGIGAYLWLIITALVSGFQHLRHANDSTAWLIETGLALQIIIVTHGLVDDVLFGSQALFMFLIPYGLLSAAFRLVGSEKDIKFKEAAPTQNIWKRFSYELLIAISCFAVVVWRFPILSVWHANLGTLAQARMELSRYEQTEFDQLTLDEIRQQEDLGYAIRSFERALSLNPSNLTAHRRLASIALARGDEAQALAHMQTAWQANHRDATTRLLLGDSLVATGDVDQAVDVIHGLTFAKERLASQAWSRYWVHDRPEQAIYAWQAVLALDPTNANAVYWIERAEQRIQTESASNEKQRP